MANTKEYQIKINGISESINAVDSLNNKLQNLEQRINAVNTSKVSSVGSSSRTSNASSLSEEEAIQREINKLKAEGEKLDAKIAATQDEIYKRVDATKQLYKETVADQKALAAAERLQADAYSNTMQGMKSHLADLKAVINTTDLGDGDKIKQMTEEANKLNEKLLELEKSYGQFGRNVGNYPSAEKLKITVAGVVQEFDNANQAAKTLGKELKTLQFKKDKGMILSDEETKRFNELPSIVAQLKSSIQDAGKPMDTLMDTMQSIVAIAQTAKGFSAFFGFDEDKVQKTVQQLLALQNALTGLQTIQKQLQSKEFLGGFFSKASAAIDVFAAKLTKTDKAAKKLSITLKTLSLLSLVALVASLAKEFYDLSKKIDDTNKATEEGLKAYAKASSELNVLEQRVQNFNGTKKEEEKLVKSLNSQYGEALGEYKSIAQWKDALRKKGAAYCQVLQKEAELQAILSLYTENYIKLQKARKAQEEGNQDTVEEIFKLLNGESNIKRVLALIKDDFIAPFTSDFHNYNDELEDEINKYEENGKDLLNKANNLQTEIDKINADNKLNDYSDQIDKNTDKTKNALENAQHELNQIEIKLMQEGLNKKLRQLDEEERQTINKLKENGRKTQAEIEKIQRAYSQLRQKEINDYLVKLEMSIKNSADNISKVKFEIDTKDIENQIGDIQNKIDKASMNRPIVNTITSKQEVTNITSGLKAEKLDAAKIYQVIFDEARVTNIGNKFYDFLNRYLESKGEAIKNRFFKTIGTEDEKVFYSRLQNMFEKEYQNELMVVKNYNLQINDTLEDSFKKRLEAQRTYDKDVRQEIINSLKEQERLNKEKLKNEQSVADINEQLRYESVQLPLQKEKDALEETIKNFKVRTEAEKKAYEQLKNDLKVIETQMETQEQQHVDKIYQIDEEFQNKRKQLELNTAKQVSSTQEDYFTQQIANFRDFQSKVNELANGQQVVDKLFGVVRYSETRRQLKELQDGVKFTLDNIRQEKLKLDVLWAMGFITPEAKNATTQQLNDLEVVFKQFFASITEQRKNTFPQLMQSLEMYISEAVNSFSQIMSAVWNAQDNQNEKEKEALDKQNEILEDKLSKQKEIVEQHKSKIDSIEDELATARGDRRQHLIDQLNAEMAAQREAQAQEKKIQKQKEANEKKQDELEKKRKKQQYHRDMIQAVVNGAMAVTYALVNKWPVPAIPMAALAASTAAAQIGIMAANKPYAKGGLLEGKSHAEGGIPVGNTGIEVEGKEYIIRKKSTAPNIEILDYINKSERKLDLDDFIEFYSSGKVKKNISQISPKSRFADGGTIPTLNSDYSFDDRLLNAFEDYSNRPVVVSVRDINARQAAVRDVQVLAGLDV